MSKSAQEVVAKALWKDGNDRIGHRPWATVRNAYMAEAGHAIAALVENGFVILQRSEAETPTTDECEENVDSGAHTERRLDGHKLFVSYNADGNVVVHAVTDGRPVTRLVFEMDADETREFADDLIEAARIVSDKP